MNVNTKHYWDTRFGSGNWEEKNGFSQTRQLTESQMPFFNIPRSFNGSICDFGCGAGDALPLYRAAWPKSTLKGVDISEAAINICSRRFGEIATFRAGDVSCVPAVDVIISSNTLEHLDDDKRIAKQLLEKCHDLFIIVPFMEDLSLCKSGEHVNTYDLDSFDALGRVVTKVYRSKGWGAYGVAALYHIDLKNCMRFLQGQKLLKRQYQIMYHISRS
jgi:SAM-dependent methyltransferase